MKTLYDISWQVTEPEYRQHPALSQSTLARYEREGFSKLDTLFDKQTSSSLTFGSLVDELITGDRDSFDKRFIVAEFPKLEPAYEKAMAALIERYGKSKKELKDIQDSDLLDVLNECDFYKRWNADTKINAIRSKSCEEYYHLMCGVEGKQVISTQDYEEAASCANTLRSDSATAVYFKPNSGDVQRYYQLKFKAVIDGIEYRCMLDLCIVDYKRKVIIPCDLKTTSKEEYDFWRSVIDWRYDIQSRLYWRVLRINMDNDPFFKDFTLADFRFICINRHTRRPLVWNFPNTAYDKDIVFNHKTFRAPWNIGKELSYYLKVRPEVPNGIKRTGLNDIGTFLVRYYGAPVETDEPWQTPVSDTVPREDSV